jgi:uncharacterized RDD family membrane protein YckC
MTICKFAGFWRRLVAYTVDNIIINMVFLILFIITFIAYISGSMSKGTNSWVAEITNPELMISVGVWALLCYVLLILIYFTYFHGLNGRSPGKMLMGLQVLTTEGNPLTFGVAFLRSVGYLISSMLFTFPLGFIWAAFDRRKQGWHDKIAGTVVIILRQDTEINGIDIPDKHPVAMTPLFSDQQSETVLQPVVQIDKIDPATDKPEQMPVDQQGINGQKIP